MAGQLPQDPRPWPVRRTAGLRDRTMRETLGRVTRRFVAAKRAVYHDYPVGETARHQALMAKRETIHRLPELLATARRQLEAHGAVTAFAHTADEAVATIRAILDTHQVRTVIKSKSMLTEELHLNEALAVHGIHVRETDLGEFIIQLAGEKPSHILAPAAHKNRAQIAALFRADAAQHGLAPPADDTIEALNHYAHDRLRQEFLTADAGMTGANMVVAETGTVVLITNEGNADMVTTVPRVLVTVVGVEKIVPTWADFQALVTQPAMSGIGRRLSSYTTLIQGPRRTDQSEGPAAWHVVFVDNGRLALRNPPYADALACIRCGACLNACPVFRQIGGHAYGSVYPGPIGVVETPALTQWAQGAELPSVACTLCHACGEICPMGIDLPRMIVQLRTDKVARRMIPATVRWSYRLWAREWESASGYRRSIRWARRGQWWYQRGGRLVGAPGLARGWFQTRTMPPIASETFHEWWERTREGMPHDV
ncbi:MAG: lactate utilization protein B [Sulfobacillus sp.]|nr:lactate utilization protein B [Sulfobacillus sp.]